jgi:hypothetical protein
MKFEEEVQMWCPDCEAVRVLGGAVTLRFCIDDDRWSFWFACPRCGFRTAGAATPRSALRAVRSGAQLEMWSYPDEIAEHRDGPPLDEMDVVDFKTALLDSEWLDELLG